MGQHPTRSLGNSYQNDSHQNTFCTLYFHILIEQGGVHIYNTGPPNTNPTFAESNQGIPPPKNWYQYQLVRTKFWKSGMVYHPKIGIHTGSTAANNGQKDTIT